MPCGLAWLSLGLDSSAHTRLDTAISPAARGGLGAFFSLEGTVMDKNLRSYVAELAGTFAFVFLAAGAVCANHLFAAPLKLDGSTVLVPQPAPGLTGVAIATGLAYAVALAVTLPLSGGYLN